MKPSKCVPVLTTSPVHGFAKKNSQRVAAHGTSQTGSQITIQVERWTNTFKIFSWIADIWKLATTVLGVPNFFSEPLWSVKYTVHKYNVHSYYTLYCAQNLLRLSIAAPMCIMYLTSICIWYENDSWTCSRNLDVSSHGGSSKFHFVPMPFRPNSSVTHNSLLYCRVWQYLCHFCHYTSVLFLFTCV